MNVINLLSNILPLSLQKIAFLPNEDLTSTTSELVLICRDTRTQEHTGTPECKDEREYNTVIEIKIENGTNPESIE